MSDSPIASLFTLPVEILHRIFDNLDTQTILLSFGRTCRYLKAVAKSYNRYVFNFKFISKFDFELLCLLIDPRNVISLTLFCIDETVNQMELFLSLVNIEYFHRLHSLTLVDIEEHHLNLVLERMNTRSLTSFSLKVGKNSEWRKNATTKLLSTVIAQSNLRNVELEISESRVKKMTWSGCCTIQQLRISAIATFDQLCTIFWCSPQLQTLVISHFEVVDMNKTSLPHSPLTPLRQLISLTIENLDTTMDNIELFLLLTPSLTHLKLIGKGDFMNGNRWEQFIQTNLPLLNKFEFFFVTFQHQQHTPSEDQSITASFRSSFWFEHKKWFVTCEQITRWPPVIKICSLPICVSCLNYESEPKQWSLLTFTSIIGDNASIMDNITTVHLDFAKLTPDDIQEKIKTVHHPMLRKVEKLVLNFNADRPWNWVSFISTLIDLTQVVQIKLSSKLIRTSNSYMLKNVASLLRQTYNLLSLDICCDFSVGKSTLTADEICFMVPSHVQHLAVSIQMWIKF